MSYEFEEDQEVMTKFPLTQAQEEGDRDAWPWLAGWVTRECGPDEWEIVVGDERLARVEAGEVVYPCVFRDSSEIRARS